MANRIAVRAESMATMSRISASIANRSADFMSGMPKLYPAVGKSYFGDNILDKSNNFSYIYCMERNDKQPKTLQEAVVFYADPNNALAYMTLSRWPDGVVTCPTCGRNDVVFLHNQRKWQCKSVHPKRQFSAKVGTI